MGLNPDRPCDVDRDCRQYGNQFPQCGYLLFDAKEKANGHDVSLKAKAGASGIERGVCTADRTKECRKKSDCDPGECSGYLLHPLP
jgi:hypothetical protein